MNPFFSIMFKMRLYKSVYVSLCSLVATQPICRAMWHRKQLIDCCTCSYVLQLQECGGTNEWTDGQDHREFVSSIRFDGGNQHLIRTQHNDGT